MSKALYFLVFMAVIAQIYTAPAAENGVDTAVKGVEGQVKPVADKAEKTAGSPGDLAQASQGFLTPAITFGKDMVGDGENFVNGFMGSIPGGVPASGVGAKN